MLRKPMIISMIAHLLLMIPIVRPHIQSLENIQEMYEVDIMIDAEKEIEEAEEESKEELRKEYVEKESKKDLQVEKTKEKKVEIAKLFERKSVNKVKLLNGKTIKIGHLHLEEMVIEICTYTFNEEKRARIYWEEDRFTDLKVSAESIRDIGDISSDKQEDKTFLLIDYRKCSPREFLEVLENNGEYLMINHFPRKETSLTITNLTHNPPTITVKKCEDIGKGWLIGGYCWNKQIKEMITRVIKNKFPEDIINNLEKKCYMGSLGPGHLLTMLHLLSEELRKRELSPTTLVKTVKLVPIMTKRGWVYKIDALILREKKEK